MRVPYSRQAARKQKKKVSSSWFSDVYLLVSIHFSSLSLDKPNTEEKMGKETSKYSLNADTANDKGNKKKLTKKNEIYQKKKEILFENKGEIMPDWLAPFCFLCFLFRFLLPCPDATAPSLLSPVPPSLTV